MILFFFSLLFCMAGVFTVLEQEAVQGKRTLAFPQLYQLWARKNKSFSKAINPEPFTSPYSNSHVQNNRRLFIQTSQSICGGVNGFAAPLVTCWLWGWELCRCPRTWGRKRSFRVRQTVSSSKRKLGCFGRAFFLLLKTSTFFLPGLLCAVS